VKNPAHPPAAPAAVAEERSPVADDVSPRDAVRAGSAPGRSVEALLRRAGERIQALEGRLAVTMAREEYDQEVTLGRWGARRLHRRTVSEVAWVPAGGAIVWTFFRDVVSVDGDPVPDRGKRLEPLFAAGATADVRRQAEALLKDSARYPRAAHDQYADARLSIRILQARPVPLHSAGLRRSDVLTTRVRFEEVGCPTLAMSNGRDLPVRGTLFLEPVEERLVRSEVRFSVDGWPVEIKVRYQGQGSTHLPVEMRDTYGSRSSDEQIEAVARYSSYRSGHVEVEDVKVAP
jgi:hypothetical protein